MKNGVIKIFDREKGLDDPCIFSIHEDGQGRLLVSTKEKGLYIMENDYILSLYRDTTGKIWISTPTGIITFKKNRFTSLLDEFPFELSLTVIEGSMGEMWFGTYYYGLYQLNNGKLRNFTMNNGLSSNIIFHLLVNQEGDLLAATNNGVCLYENGFFTSFGIKNSGERIRAVNFLFQDDEDNLFAGMEKGLFCFSNGGFYPYHKGLEGIKLTSMIQSGKLEYWMGTRKLSKRYYILNLMV
jgi:ligand-binding sensor domain-containing protein